MLDKIREIICDYVEIDPQSITPDSELRYDLGATSFDLMNIAVAIEQEFSVKVPDSALPGIKTVGDLIRALEK